MSEVVHETAPANVVFIRSVFYGIGAGGLTGLLIGIFASLSDPEFLLVGLLMGGLGALVGGTAGLILGIVVIVAGSGSSLGLRMVVAVAAMAVVFAALWILTGTPPTNPYVLLFIVPAGVGSWLLLPAVIRPKSRRARSRLPRQSN